MSRLIVLKIPRCFRRCIVFHPAFNTRTTGMNGGRMGDGTIDVRTIYLVKTAKRPQMSRARRCGLRRWIGPGKKTPCLVRKHGLCCPRRRTLRHNFWLESKNRLGFTFYLTLHCGRGSYSWVKSSGFLCWLFSAFAPDEKGKKFLHQHQN